LVDLLIARLTRTAQGSVGFPREEPLGRFQVIAVTERFLPDEARQRLRVALAPAPLLVLERLEPAKSRAFFQAWSEQHRLGWGPDHVRGLVQATRGYPLGMREAVGAIAAASPAED